MKNILVITLLFLSTNHLSYGMVQETIRLPKADVLEKRLAQDFDHFLAHSSIISQIADKDLKPLGIWLTVEQAFNDYTAKIPDFSQRAAQNLNKPRLHKLIFQDHREVFEQLKEQKWIKD